MLEKLFNIHVAPSRGVINSFSTAYFMISRIICVWSQTNMWWIRIWGTVTLITPNEDNVDGCVHHQIFTLVQETRAISGIKVPASRNLCATSVCIVYIYIYHLGLDPSPSLSLSLSQNHQSLFLSDFLVINKQIKRKNAGSVGQIGGQVPRGSTESALGLSLRAERWVSDPTLLVRTLWFGLCQFGFIGPHSLLHGQTEPSPPKVQFPFSWSGFFFFLFSFFLLIWSGYILELMYKYLCYCYHVDMGDCRSCWPPCKIIHYENTVQFSDK